MTGIEELKSISRCSCSLSSKACYLCAEGEETRKADNVIHPAKSNDSKADFSQADDAHLQEFPKCDTGCVETLLGLKNILLPSEDLFTFFKVFL